MRAVESALAGLGGRRGVHLRRLRRPGAQRPGRRLPAPWSSTGRCEAGVSGFSSLNTAVSGLAAAQRAMDVTGQNIVNANTPGYSRQRVELQEVGAAGRARRSSPATAPTSAGSPVAAVTPDPGRLRGGAPRRGRGRPAGGDHQPDRRADRRADGVRRARRHRPAGDDGLLLLRLARPGEQLDPTTAAGSVVIQRGLAVTDQLHALSSAISGEWDDRGSTALTDVLSQVNQARRTSPTSTTRSPPALAAGRPVNELEDQRDLLARKLAELIGGVGHDRRRRAGVGLGQRRRARRRARRPSSSRSAGATTLGGAAASPPKIMWGTTAVPVDSGSAAGYLAVLGGDLPDAVGAAGHRGHQPAGHGEHRPRHRLPGRRDAGRPVLLGHGRRVARGGPDRPVPARDDGRRRDHRRLGRPADRRPRRRAGCSRPRWGRRALGAVADDDDHARRQGAEPEERRRRAGLRRRGRRGRRPDRGGSQPRRGDDQPAAVPALLPGRCARGLDHRRDPRHARSTTPGSGEPHDHRA